MEINNEIWKHCSSCKKAIGYRQKYFECSVTTCQGKRTGYAFCSVFCWERHLPGARHRDAAAIEKQSPSFEQWKAELSNEGGSADHREPQRRIIVNSNPGQSQAASHSSVSKTSMDNEVLVVVSKMKTYIKERADMNTSNDVADMLSQMIRILCDDAVDRARADSRKTVMARDFKFGK